MSLPTYRPNPLQDASVQTDTIFDLPCNIENVSIDQLKLYYDDCLGFVNRCHNFINTVFYRECELSMKIPEKTVEDDDCRIVQSVTTKATFEQIITACNDFQSKSVEYLVANDMRLNEPTKTVEEIFTNVTYYTDEKSSQVLDNIIDYPISKSPRILNQPSSESSQKVNEMFRKISKEEISCKSSSESTILSDEEFSRRYEPNVQQWLKQNEKEITYPTLKSNPLKLTDKDKAKTNEKILRSMGLFTDDGEIQPRVRSILEEKQRLSENQPKNIQFRAVRNVDNNVAINNSNRYVQNGFDQPGSLSSSSTCSTISDSDLIKN